MATLSEAEAAASIQCPKEIGVAIKMLAADPAHARAWAFIVDVLCGTDRLSFALPDESPAVMGWRQGRRYVGLTLREIVATPIPEDEPRHPPARTMTETARRRTSAGART